MNNHKHTDKIKAKITEQEHDFIDHQSLMGVYIFFSYDLMNSTKYKTVNKTQWPLVIRRFYELIEDGVKKWLTNVHLWKYVGDELLLYKKLRSIVDIHDCIPKAYRVLHDSIDRLHSEFSDTKTILSVKAAVWCARVYYIAPQNIQGINEQYPGQVHRNIVAVHLGGSNREGLDFLGPDIDVGFRIAKFAIRKRLVVGADLAYLLYKERSSIDKIDKKLRIVSYEPLKGIWEERRYPIIWYEENWEKISESFLYDERYESEIINRIINKSSEIEEIENLEKVYEDLNQKGEIQELWNYLKAEGTEANEEPASSEMLPGNLAEIHCVAICFRDDGRILIAKRPDQKRRFPNLWEFGCGQLRMFETFEACLRRSYKEDFAVELEFGTRLQPIRTYLIDDEDENRKIPGIVFIADVTNPDDVRALRHAKIDWFDPARMDHLSDSECVPEFKETICLADQAWKLSKGMEPTR